MGSAMNHWVIRDPEGKRSYKVLEPNAAVSLRLTVAASTMRRNPLAETTVDKYVTAGLAFFDYPFRETHGSSCAYSPWQSPPNVRAMLEEMLEAEGCTLSANEAHCTVTVTAPAGRFNHISELVSAVYHYYVAMSRAKVYPFGNPFEIPVDLRQPLRIASPGGGTMMVTPTFRFRMADRPRGVRRMDDPGLVAAILYALRAFPSFPPALLMLFQVMAQGLSRVAEQVALTVLDWWKSRFGTELATPNKGDGVRRTKTQVIENELADAMGEWFDTLRRPPKGSVRRTRAEWKAFLENEDMPLSVREAAAAAEPLFTRPNGLAYKAGGARKWFAKAVRAFKRAASAATLVTRTHYLRHAGVNTYLALLEADQTLSADQKNERKRLFGEHMGWKWPLHTMGTYSAPQREAEKLAVAREFLSAVKRNDDLIKQGHGSVVRIDMLKNTANDEELQKEFDAFRIAA